MQAAFMEGTVIISDGKVIENGVVVVEKDRIVQMAEGKTANW